MSTPSLAERAAALRLLGPAIALLSVMLPIAGCAPLPPPFIGADPIDSASPVALTSYRSGLSGYRSQRPVDPGSWIEQNQRVAPENNR